MRTTGKIVLYLGIATLVLGCGGPLLLLAVTFMSSPDAFWASLMIGFVIGIPALVIGGILVLIGAVMATSSPEKAHHQSHPAHSDLIRRYSAPVSTMPSRSRYGQAAQAASRFVPPHPDDAVRAALTQPAASPLRPLVLVLRGLALCLLAWFFVPSAVWNFRFFSIMGSDQVGFLAISMVKDFILAAILPLILWLLSDVIKVRTQAAEPRSA